MLSLAGYTDNIDSIASKVVSATCGGERGLRSQDKEAIAVSIDVLYTVRLAAAEGKQVCQCS